MNRQRSKGSHPCDVLLACASGHVGYQVLRSLARHGLRVCVCDSSASSPSFHSRYATAVALCPDPRADEIGFVRFVAQESVNRGVKLCMPVFYPEILAKHRNMLPKGVILPLDTCEKINCLDDKLSANALAVSLGIPVPRTISEPDSVEEWPVVFKRAGGLGGSAVYFPGNRKALDNLLKTARPGKYLLTEYIDGYDCCVDVVRMGDYFSAWAYRVIAPKSKGMSALRVSVDAPILLGYAKSILEAIDYNGLCGMDFRIRNSDGSAYFLECNPRFSGGIASQLASGFDLPWILWQLAIGENIDFSVKYTAGVYTQNLGLTYRYLNGLFKKRKADLRTIASYLFPRTLHFDDLDLTDLSAFAESLG